MCAYCLLAMVEACAWSLSSEHRQAILCVWVGLLYIIVILDKVVLLGLVQICIALVVGTRSCDQRDVHYGLIMMALGGELALQDVCWRW
jgi:hypothetical protein